MTEGHLRRAYPDAGRRGVSRDILAAAALDVAFDVVLHTLATSDVLRECGLVFKGGTALRKFHIGHRGRFSFDMDFATPEDPAAVSALIGEAFAAREDFGSFGFAVGERRGHHSIGVTTTVLPGEHWDIKLDFSDRPLALAPLDMTLLPTPLHDHYPFAPTFTVPVIALDENIAEKLSRWRARPLVRDLSDLSTLARRVSSHSDVAAMYVLKSYIGWAATAPNRRPPRPAAPLCESLATLDIATLDATDLLLPTKVDAGDKQRLVEEWIQTLHPLFLEVDDRARSKALRRFTGDRTGRFVHLASEQLSTLGASGGTAGRDADAPALGPDTTGPGLWVD